MIDLVSSVLNFTHGNNFENYFDKYVLQKFKKGFLECHMKQSEMKDFINQEKSCVNK